jgi:hypothetical protein
VDARERIAGAPRSWTTCPPRRQRGITYGPIELARAHRPGSRLRRRVAPGKLTRVWGSVSPPDRSMRAAGVALGAAALGRSLNPGATSSSRALIQRKQHLWDSADEPAGVLRRPEAFPRATEHEEHRAARPDLVVMHPTDQIMTNARSLRVSLCGAPKQARGSHASTCNRTSSAGDVGHRRCIGAGAILDAAPHALGHTLGHTLGPVEEGWCCARTGTVVDYGFVESI